MGPKGGTGPNAGLIFKSKLLATRIISMMRRKGHLVRFRCSKVFRRVLSRLKRVPLPPCVARRLGSGGHCRAMCTGCSKSTTTPATKLRFAGRLLRGMGSVKISVTRMALRIKLNAFHPMGMRGMLSRRVRSRFCVISRRTTSGVGHTGRDKRQIVTINAADAHALRTTTSRGKQLRRADN